ncbi:MAG: MgtC/SapB family protein [Planctomycetota bacterium]
MSLAPYADFALALAIGALVGIEREQKKRAGELGTGGLRTFVLLAETGALAAWLAVTFASPWIFGLAGLAVTSVVVAGYWLENRARADALGMTSEIAALVVFLLGGMVVQGEARLAVALAIATSAVLAFKEPLHGFAAKLGGEDLRAGLKLLIATFIVLPVLPREAIDPWGVLRPYAMWWLVILISSLSLAGYVATRALGARHGLKLTALAGGLVSSTAVTLAFARKSRAGDAPSSCGALAAGILLAWAVMFVRVLLVTAAIHLPLARVLALPCATMAVLALASAWWLARGADPRASGPDLAVKNPFRLLASVRLALFFAAVQLVIELVRREFPASGVQAVAALAGLTDVDAITLSMTELARQGELGTAATAILVAMSSNTLVKLGLALTLGAPALGRALIVPSVLLLGAGAVALWLT